MVVAFSSFVGPDNCCGVPTSCCPPDLVQLNGANITFPDPCLEDNPSVPGVEPCCPDFDGQTQFVAGDPSGFSGGAFQAIEFSEPNCGYIISIFTFSISATQCELRAAISKSGGGLDVAWKTGAIDKPDIVPGTYVLSPFSNTSTIECRGVSGIGNVTVELL